MAKRSPAVLYRRFAGVRPSRVWAQRSTDNEKVGGVAERLEATVLKFKNNSFYGIGNAFSWSRPPPDGARNREKALVRLSRQPNGSCASRARQLPVVVAHESSVAIIHAP
ncbi:MAG: hypothetical protein HY287_06675 [Planctomycetes bacterium]|nr:hypothetical protein [Planctomycetota bacterium]